MTQNQISFYKAQEDKRHNLASEALSQEQNKINKQHLKRQDTYTSEHYERSDSAGLISANASAMNAQAAATNAATNRKNYEMQHDIEYGWTSQPLQVVWYDPDTGKETRPGEGSVLYNYPKGMPLSAQQKDAQAMSALYSAVYAPRQQEAEIAEKTSNALNKTSGAFGNVFNALFGKQGLMGAMQSIITE